MSMWYGKGQKWFRSRGMKVLHWDLNSAWSDITVYRHHFSHHFDFFILVQPQRESCKTSYIGCCIVCLDVYTEFFAISYNVFTASENICTKMWPDWCPKLSLLTPMGTELKVHQQSVCCLKVTRKVGVGQYMISIANIIQYTRYNHAWWGIEWLL